MEPDEKYDWWETMPTVDTLLAEHHTEFYRSKRNLGRNTKKSPKSPIPLEVALYHE